MVQVLLHQLILKINLFLNNNEYFTFDLQDFYLTDLAKYAKKNIDIPAKTSVDSVIDTNIEIVNKNTVSHPITVKERPQPVMDGEDNEEVDEAVEDKPVKEEKSDKEGFEQISIFDDLDE